MATMGEERARHASDDASTVAIVLAGAAILRVLAVIGQQAFVYVDSIDYETLDFSGGSRRPWATPLLYATTDRLPTRIILQAMIGAACWSYLAVVASLLADDRRVRWAVLVAILSLSLTTTVTNWDTAMLSESLALSCSALVLGALLRVAQLRSFGAVLVALGAWVLWIFTRQNHLVLGWLVITALAFVLFVSWLRTRALDRVVAALLGGLVAISVVALLSYRENTEIVDFNVATVIGGRVLPDLDHVVWFVDHGMPIPSAVPVGAAASPEQLLEDPAFERWLRRDGITTYARFLATHPWHTITRPLESLVSDRPPFGDAARADEVLLASPDAYGVSRQVLPEPIEDLLFQPGSAGTLVFALAGVLVLTVRRWRRHGADPRWLVPVLAVALQWPALTVVWHASVAELGRLALPCAVVLRVGILLQLALLADVWLGERSATRPVVAGRREP
ncbi:MAG: hypothetical protein ACRDZU_02035 [Acidimicrobiales bacterium]